MTERVVSEDVLRDLIHCVQAARDGAPDDTLFAMQCDLTLARVAREANELIPPRRSVAPRRRSTRRTCL